MTVHAPDRGVLANGQWSRQPLGKLCRMAATARESHPRADHRPFTGLQVRRLLCELRRPINDPHVEPLARADTLVLPDVFVVPLEQTRTLDWSRIPDLLLVAEVLSPSSARARPVHQADRVSETTRAGVLDRRSRRASGGGAVAAGAEGSSRPEFDTRGEDPLALLGMTTPVANPRRLSTLALPRVPHGSRRYPAWQPACPR